MTIAALLVGFAVDLTSVRAESNVAAGWKAAAAKTVITPKQPMWMSGYGNRDRPSEGTLHDLWCKALVIEDPSGHRATVVSVDLCGVSKSVSDTICRQITEQLGIRREAIMICCSHTHTGPMIENNLETMFELSREENGRIAAYTRELEGNVVRTVADALGRLEPARLSWANGTATFAVNRRNNPEPKVPELRERGELRGPVDHDVPVLCVRDAAGAVKAVVFGYACHCTVLSFYQWSGDYAGFAQIELEKSHPGAVALFFAGCGADQNPLPRRSVEQAQQYGRELADSVNAVLRGTMNPAGEKLSSRYELLSLPFDSLPTHEELERQAAGTNPYEARRAKLFLKQIAGGQRLPETYPYPIQVWQLDTALTWIALGGEVTVGYSTRLKRETGPGQTWVAAYANDVMAYIPTRRVWDEGGYEGAGAMVYYGLPTRWAGDVEERIVTKVHELVSPK
jgi:hypothetical protein